MSLLSKIQSLITAANNTTGESDATLTDAVQTLVDGYGQGGGTLPSSISKIDGGSFTFATIQNSVYHITHNLGVVPRGFVIWSDSVDLSTTGNNSVIRGVFIVDNAAENRVTSFLYQMTAYNGNFSNYARSVGSNYSGYANENYINYNVSNVSFAAGVEYKWFAFA